MPSAHHRTLADAAPLNTPVAGDGTITERLENAMDLDTFTPRLLAIISNKIAVRESQTLLRLFNLGTTDWRIISALAGHPGLSATEISQLTVMSKAVISRSLGGLVERGLIVQDDGPRGSRPLFLTEDGAKSYEDMLPITERGQRLVERTLTGTELSALHGFLNRLIAAADDESAWAD